jgi:phosphopantothenoylcysteine decarboxylase/phosphopantothenate--cysteine ligase
MANILIISTGSIAAVKIPDLVSKLVKLSHKPTCVLTNSAQKFVTADSLSYLSGNKTHTDLFDADDESKMQHIQLSRDNDIVLVAPASADFIAKMANGFCNDLASTICLAANKKMVVAPAMNTEMYIKPATKRNIEQLKTDGVLIIDPENGLLACGEQGLGRMAEVDDIISILERELMDNFPSTSNEEENKDDLLAGLTCLVTSGPTRENIDPVRYISNYSSGKQGYAIAESLANYGADVTLVSGPTNIEPPHNVRLVDVQSADEMKEACEKLLPVNIAVCTAAVADWKPEFLPEHKIKKIKGEDSHAINLIENPDILFELSNSKAKRPELVVGFAAETENLLENAFSKLKRKNCDWIVANNVAENDVFNSDINSVKIISSEGIMEEADNIPKTEVADILSNLISDYFNNTKISYLKTN